MQRRPVPVKEDDVLAWITVRLHTNGTISTQGTLQQPGLAEKLLRHALDAVNSAMPADRLIIPARDVNYAPPPGLIEVGDMGFAERGDD